MRRISREDYLAMCRPLIEAAGLDLETHRVTSIDMEPQGFTVMAMEKDGMPGDRIGRYVFVEWPENDDDEDVEYIEDGDEDE